MASREVVALARGVKLIFEANPEFEAVSLCDERVAMFAGLKIFVEMHTASALQHLSHKNSREHFSQSAFSPRRRESCCLTNHGRH
jgi:hypothetical protein